MEPLRCEVVGCGALAAWVRVSDLDNAHEDLLCRRCWVRLRRLKPTQASFYVMCDEAMTDIPLPALLVQNCEEDADAGFLIG